MYIPILYPRWLYHATEPARLVAGYEEHEALGDEWATHPDLVPAAATDVTTPTPKRKRATTNGSK